MKTELIHIIPIPAFADNYIWLLHNNLHAVVIDPGDAAAVTLTLQQLNLELVAICITHHHADHIGGVKQLINQYEPNVYASQYGDYDFDHTALSDAQTLSIDVLGLEFKILWLPGHTQDHIAYLNHQNLFCGDVLFAAGCGRLLDGTATQMLESLNKLKRLPPETRIYCAHEYTATNIEFALTIDPNNLALIHRKQETSALSAQGKPTIPSTLSIELKTNPFLRCASQSIIENTKPSQTDELSVFTKIRELRNHY